MNLLILVLALVGTTIAAIVSLLVCSGDQRVSTKDAFTLFENNTGWTNGKLSCQSYQDSVLNLERWVGVPFGVHRADVDSYWL
jgi:hypothetical protein